ncbi:TPA: hypothetical protein EYP66_06005 [Candidatus Poribacteria bacterium]|nr:hypothetical protein [Candidatus Poribacteria bacterium]
MKAIRLVDVTSEGEKLLSLDYKSASQLFQSYSTEQQLAIIKAMREPKKREELYYLVPDSTELVQQSKTEDVLQVIHTMFGTGLTIGFLSAISAEQFEEMLDMTIFRDGKLDEEALNTWIGELAECDEEDLKRLLPQIDIAVLVQMLRGKVDVSDEPIAGVNAKTYKGQFAEEGILNLNALEYENEQVRFIMETIWRADEDYFMRIMYELFAEEDEFGLESYELEFLRAKEERDERIHKRDEEIGISIDEEEMFEEVDLGNLELEDDDEGEDYG